MDERIETQQCLIEVTKAGIKIKLLMTYNWCNSIHLFYPNKKGFSKRIAFRELPEAETIQPFASFTKIV